MNLGIQNRFLILVLRWINPVLPSFSGKNLQHNGTRINGDAFYPASLVKSFLNPKTTKVSHGLRELSYMPH